MPRRARKVEDKLGYSRAARLLAISPCVPGVADSQPGGANGARDMAMAEIPMGPCHVPKRRRLRQMMTIITQSGDDFALDGVPISS